jgi:hypothetical protein
MIKKRKKLIIIFAVTAVLLTCAYFFVVSPLVAKWMAVQEEIPELLPGEVLGSNNRILMFEHVEKAAIQEIEVHNEYGAYAMYRDVDDEFYVRDNKGAPYDLTALSSLVVSAGYTLSMTRVTTECEDWEMYGLDEYSNPSWYKLTTIDGSVHTVYIGDMIPTGAGYYCRYIDRDAVYILDSSLAMTLLAPVTNLITPILAFPLKQNDYFTVRDFYIIHGEETKIWVDYIADGVQVDQPNTTFYEMKVPANYIPSTNYETVLQTFINFTGLKTLEIGPTNEVMSDEILAKYGLDDPAWTIHYKYSDIDNYIFFSEQNEDGTYYAYSLVFNLVALVDGATVDFFNWDLIRFVDSSLFMLNINDIATIDVESGDFSVSFDLVGEGTDIQITPSDRTEHFDETDVKNFRQVYKTYLSLKLEDYTDSHETENLILTLRFVTDAGKSYEFKFYAYSTRRCYYTVNGEGEFYVLRDMVEKAVSDTRKVLSGEMVDSWAKN